MTTLEERVARALAEHDGFDWASPFRDPHRDRWLAKARAVIAAVSDVKDPDADAIAALKTASPATEPVSTRGSRLDLDLLTMWVFEDVSCVARQAFPGKYHFVDELRAMTDDRLVGVQVWKTIKSNGEGK